MTEDRDVTLEHPGTAELARALDAFASARLAPDRHAMQRVRAAVIEEARMRSLESRMGIARHRHVVPRSRVAAVLLAATLTLGAVVSVFASSAPGGPLYGARIWVETAFLPADPSGRAQERIHQIEERLLEAERAAASGDANAVAAATQAYADAVDAAVSEAGTDMARLGQLQAALGVHVAVLETLATDPPGRALGLQKALAASQQAVQELHAATSNGQGPDAGNAGGNGGSQGGSGGGSGAATPEPAAQPTDEPIDTPKPGRTPDADATSRPTPSHADGASQESPSESGASSNSTDGNQQ